ncbi:MAG: acyl-CoA thioesterase, partial [Bacteroidales bacterium]
GKVGYFETVWGKYINWREVGLVVARIESDFISPVVMNEPITVLTAVTKIGNKSLTFSQCIINSTSKEIKASCETIMAGFDIDANRTDSITSKCIEAISTYEERGFNRVKK